VALFFVSFIVIVGWTLLQVVVAVLLDNFTAAGSPSRPSPSFPCLRACPTDSPCS